MRMAATTALVCAFLFGAAGYAESPTVSAATCERLSGSLSLPNTTVLLAQVVAAGTFVPPGGVRPRLEPRRACRRFAESR